MNLARFKFYHLLIPLTLAALFFPPSHTQAGIISQPTRYFMSNGLVGYWSFNANDKAQSKKIVIFDRSGQGNNGAVGYATSTYIARGKIGQAMQFDSTDDKVWIPSSSSLDNLGTMTISAWIYPRSFGAGSKGRIYAKGTGHLNFLVNNVDTTAGLEFFRSQTVAPNLSALTNGNEIKLNTWQHVLVTYDNSNTRAGVTFYVNGTQVSKSAGGADGGGTAASEAGLAAGIGSEINTDTRVFDGTIDEVRVYNRMLTFDEIKRLYNQGASRVNKSLPSRVANGLVGHWTFDGSDKLVGAKIRYTDRSGNNNIGYLKSATSTPGALGRIGQAQNFDGVDDFVDMGNPASLQITGSLTVSAWVKADAFPNGDDNYIVTKAGDSNKNFKLSATIDNAVRQFYMMVSSDGSLSTIRYTSTTVTANTWYHVVGVYNASLQTLDIYLNGKLDNGTLSGTIPSSIFNSPLNVLVGAYTTSPIRNFDGVIDDVRIYNRAITADEIKRLYSQGTSQVNISQPSRITGGLMHHWTFDTKDMGRSKKIVYFDRSSNGNRGYLMNGTTTQALIGKIGQGLWLDGVDDYVEGSTFTPPTQGTAAIWVKPVSLGTAVRRVWGTNTNFEAVFDLGKFLDGDICGNGPITSASAFATGVWYHIVFTWDDTADVINLYVNGTLNNTSSALLDCSNLAGNIIVGWRSGGAASERFSGALDEFRVYNRILTPAEIRQLYNMGR